jgi:septal ring factor EnvC (AmiA/AmiB activator)
MERLEGEIKVQEGRLKSSQKEKAELEKQITRHKESSKNLKNDV